MTIGSVCRTVAGLSGGQRQAIAVVKAVMWNTRLVILDEPTAALAGAQTRQVLDLVKCLAEQGLAVMLVSHNLHDIFEVADRITVLRLGRDVARFNTKDTTRREVVEAITAVKRSTVPGQEAEARDLAPSPECGTRPTRTEVLAMSAITPPLPTPAVAPSATIGAYAGAGRRTCAAEGSAACRRFLSLTPSSSS